VKNRKWFLKVNKPLFLQIITPGSMEHENIGGEKRL
jgi:hypothetical protein